MNDDDLTELILRASAYLDGELDAVERARAEADPAVMAEVESLRSLQAEIRDVAPPTTAVREAAIAAALSEFDSAGAAAAARSDRVVPFRPRPSYSRWLTAAAAVVAVGLVGVVVAQSNLGGDDEQSGLEAAVTEASSTDRGGAAAADAELESSITDSTPFAAEMAPAEATAEAGELVATDAPAAIENAPEADPDDLADSPPSTEVTTFGTVAPGEVSPTTASRTLDGPVTEDTLFAVGRDLLARFEAGTLGATPETSCEFGSYVVLARAGFVVGDGQREAIIAADPDRPEVGAFDATTCQEFAIVTGE